MLSTDQRGSLNYSGRRYLPYAFTEQGITILSAVLRSEIAIKVSIEIMNAFVEMSRMLISNTSLFHRLDKIEIKQLETEQKIEAIFKALESDKLQSEKYIFYNGQIFDAYTFVSYIIGNAKSSIIVLDNYVDDTVLSLLGKRNNNVTATIYTKVYAISYGWMYNDTIVNILRLRLRFLLISTTAF